MTWPNCIANIANWNIDNWLACKLVWTYIVTQDYMFANVVNVP